MLNLKGNGNKNGIHFLIYVNSRIREECHRLGNVKRNLFPYTQRAARCNLDIQELHLGLEQVEYGYGIAGTFQTAYLSVQFLLVILSLALCVLYDLGAAYLGHQFERVRYRNQLHECVSGGICDTYLQGIHVIDGGILHPEGEGVISDAVLQHVCIVFIKIESLYYRHGVYRKSESQCELSVGGAFVTTHVLNDRIRRESQKRYVIGHETCERNDRGGIDSEVRVEYGVLTEVEFCCGYYDGVQPGYLLVTLRVAESLVHIHHGINPVFSGSYASYRKMTAAVGT